MSVPVPVLNSVRVGGRENDEIGTTLSGDKNTNILFSVAATSLDVPDVPSFYMYNEIVPRNDFQRLRSRKC